MTALGRSSMMSTEVRLVQSKATGKSYQLSIALPFAYQDAEFCENRAPC